MSRPRTTEQKAAHAQAERERRAAAKGVAVEAPSEPAVKIAEMDEVTLYRAAQAEHAATKAHREAVRSGETTDPPATPHLDELHARRAAGRRVTARRRSTRTEKRTTFLRTETEHTCSGPCGQTKPTNKFPTIDRDTRGTECRECRDARIAAKTVRTSAAS